MDGKDNLDYNPHNNMFVIMGASNHSDFEREKHDYYATDPQAVENFPNNSAICYCWYIWEKGFKGEPVIRWI